MLWADYITIGYVLVMAVLGIYTHSLNFIMPSVLGLMCFAAIVAMSKWCAHHKEVSEEWMDVEKSKGGDDGE